MKEEILSMTFQLVNGKGAEKSYSREKALTTEEDKVITDDPYDPEIKARAAENLKPLGLSLSEFIRLKRAEIAHADNSLQPNKDTLDAIERLNTGKGLHFQNAEEMFSYLDKR